MYELFDLYEILLNVRLCINFCYEIILWRVGITEMKTSKEIFLL